jgi:hypothetical protein
MAVLLAIVFVLTAVAALLLIGVDQELLVSSTYKNALASRQVYNRLPGIVAEQLVVGMNFSPCAANSLRCENIDPQVKDCVRAALGDQRFSALSTSDVKLTDAEIRLLQGCVQQYQPDLHGSATSSGVFPGLIKSIDAGALERAIAGLLPPAQLKPLADDLLDQFFSYITGRQAAITINLVGLKQSLAGQAGLDALLNLIRSQPSCTLQQLENILVVSITSEGDPFLCRPSDELLDLVTPLVQSMLNVAVSTLPDTKMIALPESLNSRNFGPFGKGPAGGIRLALTLVRVSPDIPLFALLLISLLVIRSPRSLLRWWGIPLFFAGLLSLILAWAASIFFERGWMALIIPRLPLVLAPGLVAMIHDLLRTVLQTYLKVILYAGGSMALLGLGMWIGSGFIRTKIEPPAPAALSIPVT